MPNVMIPSRSVRKEDTTKRNPVPKRLDTGSLLRLIKRLLRRVEISPPGGSLPPDWPVEDSDQSGGEDENYYYYYFYCPDMREPHIDINFHKGLVMVRVEK